MKRLFLLLLNCNFLTITAAYMNNNNINKQELPSMIILSKGDTKVAKFKDGSCQYLSARKAARTIRTERACDTFDRFEELYNKENR